MTYGFEELIYPRRSVAALMLTLFCAAMFVSAALMFAFEPMVGQMLLPLVGGAPSGWVVAMAFFQVMLLLGYFAAHLLSRFSPAAQTVCYISLLAAACLFLPVSLAPSGTHASALNIFVLLTVSAGVPFAAIAMTSSTLQRLFMTTGHPAARDPYFLYAAGNLGSFAGLLLYPFAIDPAIGLTAQSHDWTIGFVMLMAIAGLCLVAGGSASIPAMQAKPIAMRQRAEWIALSFVPSSLLLGVTTQISTDIFSAPMIWVLPLALYLLTFVLAFSRRPVISPRALARLQPAAIAVTLVLLCTYDADLRGSSYAIALHLAAFAVVALACHQRLADRRPRDSDRQLTEYYLMIAVGGALGGIVNAFLVPIILDRLVEYPAVMILSCLLNPALFVPARRFRLAAAFSVAGAAIYGAYSALGRDYIHGHVVGYYTNGMFFGDLLLLCAAIFAAFNLRAALFGGLALLLVFETIVPSDTLLSERNFYGVVKIYDRPQEVDGKLVTMRVMIHGTTTHGFQVLDPAYERTPTAYYWRGGPAGSLFDVYAPGKIAVVGLGAGTLNCYSTPKSEFTYFEIDPAVARIASDRKVFSYLSACKGRRAPEIVTGDGRIELAASPEKFDLIVLDAFSSDAIPRHLLTLEALRVYLSHLAPNGLIAFHISNRYFRLEDVLAADAKALGLKGLIATKGDDDLFYAAPSKWFVMARPGASLAPLRDYGWNEPAAGTLAPWTDDHANMLGALKSPLADLWR